MKKYLKAIGAVLGVIILWRLALYIVNMGCTLTYTVSQSETISNVVRVVLLMIILILIINTELVKSENFKKISFSNIGNLLILSVGMDGIQALISKSLSTIFPSYLKVSESIFNSSDSYLQLIIIVILGPILEEMLFRGIIFGYLKKNFNIIAAVIVQALVFGVVHGNIVQGVYAFISGILLAIVYLHYESIFACIIVHMTINLLGTLVNVFLVSKINNEIISIILFAIMGIVCTTIPVIKMIKEYKSKKDEKISI